MVGHNNHVLTTGTFFCKDPSIWLATVLSGLASGNRWSLRFCFIQDSSWLHWLQYFTVVYMSFAICHQKKWCLKESYTGCSLGYPCNIQYWDIYSILGRSATELYFWPARSTGVCGTRTTLQPYVNTEMGCPKVLTMDSPSRSEACDCRNRSNAEVYPTQYLPL